MKMKKLALAAGLCAGWSAMAQTTTSVTLYGIVDVSVRHQSGLTSGHVRSPASVTAN